MIDRKNEDIISEVADLKRTIDNKKSTQFTGSSNIITYENQTDNIWDADFITQPPFGLSFININFVNDTQVAASCSLAHRIYIDGIPLNESGLMDGVLITGLSSINPDISVGKRTSNWNYRVDVGVGKHIQAKFIVISTDKGELFITSS